MWSVAAARCTSASSTGGRQPAEYVSGRADGTLDLQLTCNTPSSMRDEREKQLCRENLPAGILLGNMEANGAFASDIKAARLMEQESRYNEVQGADVIRN